MSDYEAYQLLSSLGGSTGSNTTGIQVWAILAPIFAVVGAILLYFLFVKPKDDPANKTAKAFKDFLAFKNMKVESLLQLCYYGATFYCILTSFNYLALGSNFIFPFFCQLILGPIIIRVVFEVIMAIVGTWRNTSKK